MSTSLKTWQYKFMRINTTETKVLSYSGDIFSQKSEQIMFSLILRGTSVGHCFTRYFISSKSKTTFKCCQTSSITNAWLFWGIHASFHRKLLQINQKWLKLTNLALQPSFIFGPRTPMTSCLKKNSSLTRSKILENQQRVYKWRHKFTDTLKNNLKITQKIYRVNNREGQS